MTLIADLGRRLPASVRPALRRPLVAKRRLGLRPQDTVLVSYPRSGSTWLRFMLGFLMTGEPMTLARIRRDLPPLGRQRGGLAALPGGGRLIRTHDPISVFGEAGAGSPKLIYLVRDGREVAASYLAFLRSAGLFSGSEVEFADRFIAGELDNYGPWSSHARESLGRDGDRFLAVRYEDLRSRTAEELVRVAAFTGLPTDAKSIEAAIAASGKDRISASSSGPGAGDIGARRGTRVVRPDHRPGWADQMGGEATEKLERSLSSTLELFGYR